jgi:L-fucose isomerase-like protein
MKVVSQRRDLPKIGFLSTSVGVFSKEGKEKAESQLRDLFKSLIDEKLISADSQFYPSRIFGPLEAKQVAKHFTESRVDGLVILNSAFPNGNAFLALATDPYLSKIPFVLTAPPELELATGEWSTNAFCGVIMNNFVAKEIDKRPLILCGWPVDEKYRQDFKAVLRVINTIKQLRQTVLGRFGDAPSGFHSATGNQVAYAKVFGVIVETIDLSAILQVYNTGRAEGYNGQICFNDNDVMQTYEEMIAGREVLVEKENVKKAARLYNALKVLIEAYGLNAISIRCWPEMQGPPFNLSACFSISWLLAKGIVNAAACEGDWPTAVSQVIATTLSGKPAACLDFVNQLTKSTIQLGHCGVGIPGLMINEQIGENSPSRQNGVSLSPTCIGQFRYGIKTGVSIIQDRDCFKMLSFRGENRKDTAQNLKYCAADVEIKDPEKLQEIVLGEGFSHHLAVASGDISQELKLLCKFYDIQHFSPDGNRE